MGEKVLIVADDLTGALDSAVGFAAAGRTVRVARHPEGAARVWSEGCDVLAINTGSREVPADVACARVSEALSGLNPQDFDIIIKKVDSRLKGNVGAETEVLLAWSGAEQVVAAPAIPTMGRLVEDGSLIGAGVDQPIPISDRFTSSVTVPDVVSDTDLDRLVQAGRGALFVGARGLAFALARASGVSAPETGALRDPVMIANGSRDPVTTAQISAVEAIAPVLHAPNGVLLGDPSPDGPVILSIAQGDETISGAQAAAQFAQSILACVRRCEPASLLICGGESAQAALDLLGVESLQVISELRPGLPLCEVEAPWGPLKIVTKSGGFGDPALLREVLQSAQEKL